MRTLRRFFQRLRSWTTAREDEERLRVEIEAHIALQTDENMRAGLSAEEARRQAVCTFGPVEAVKETYREHRGLPSIEIGVRMALGATPRDAVAMVLRGALGLIPLGLVLGLPLTLAAGRFLGHQLYGMNPYNPVVVLTAVAALGLSAFFASLIPALRASRISPVDALRAD